MSIKRISLALLIAAAASLLCAAAGLEKRELLELGYKGGSSDFIRYSLSGLNILVVRQAESVFKVRMLNITGNQLELIGALKCKSGAYAAVASQNRISLFDSMGDLAAYYDVSDTGREIISCCISDIDGDPGEELLVVEGDGRTFYGDRLVMLSCEEGLRKRYEREFKELNPWKVQVSDVDGDLKEEIALGVYKEASFHPVMAKRPFLYRWNEGDIAPMWRGSRLSRPFDDYIFFDIDADGKDEIIAVERLQDGRALINAYRWAGFGFESIAESAPYADISALVKQHDGRDSLLVRITEGKRQPWVELEKSGERLVEKAEFSNIVLIKK